MGLTSEWYIAIQDSLMQTVRDAEEGGRNVLDALIELEGDRRQLETCLAIINEFKQGHQEQIMYETEKHRGRYKGYIIEARNGRTMYSFKGIPEWDDKEKERKAIEEYYKSLSKLIISGQATDYKGALPEISYAKSSIIVRKDETN